jgi:hypothetical protein
MAKIFSAAAHAIEMKITLRRPKACENALDSTIETAKKAVVRDKASALLAGLTAKVLVNAGSSGCTQ